MKVKTADLIGPALDWAVAKCEGLPLRRDPMGFKTGLQAGWWVWDGEGQNEIVGHRRTRRDQHDGYSPSTNWAQGGPIIEREWIELGAYHDQWRAVFHDDDGSIYQDGPTPLIAAMRCFVASRLGDEVDVPDELV